MVKCPVNAQLANLSPQEVINVSASLVRENGPATKYPTDPVAFDAIPDEAFILIVDDDFEYSFEPND